MCTSLAYALPFSVAAALLTSAAFAILVRRVKGLASLALVLILLKSATALRALVHGLPASGDSAQGSLIQVLDQRADLPIAVLDPEDYGRFRLFGPNRSEKRMVLVSVLPGELPTGVDPAVSDSLYTLALSDTALHRFISVPVQDLANLLIPIHAFCSYRALGPEEVLSKRRRLCWLAESDGRDVYLVERTDQH